VAAPLPAVLRVGGEALIGEARIERGPDGLVRGCDPHGCVEVVARPEVPVALAPIPAGRRLLEVSCIFVEFERPVYAEPGDTIWFHAPLDIDLRVGRVSAARLAAVRVKYTLLGDVVDGLLCRYYRSPASLGGPPAEPGPGVALAAARVGGEAGVHQGAALAADSRLYVGGGLVYYEMHGVSVDSGLATSKRLGRPPLEGLRLVWKPQQLLRRLTQGEALTYRLLAGSG
jgi:hypothetical protein